jgi:phospholipase C
MDKFPTSTGTSKGFNFGSAQGPTNEACKSTDVLNYYDGNTVTGLWNYAQHFAMSDNSFGTTFGPSAPGAINLVSGDTGGVSTPIRSGVSSDIAPNGLGGFSMIDDAQPYYDDCSSRDALSLTGKNIGDELNTAGLSWGWFQGGFGATTAYSGPPTAAGSYNPLKVTGGAVCGATHNVGVAVAANVTGSPTVRPDRTDTGAAKGPYGTKADYIPHHEPFQYYASTANPHHIAPASPSAVGTDTQTYTNGKPNFDAANHNYDVSDFDNLVSMITAGQLPASQLPAVSFLKAPGYEDGHAGYSDPYDEQAFVTKEVSALEHSPDWSSTAIFISYDDSDGWYDHVDASIENGGQPQNASTGAADTLTGATACGAPSVTTTIGKVLGRCGLGPRLPLIAISPYAKVNYVDHNLSDQTSIINLVEYNWHLPSIAGSFDARLASSGRPFDLSGMFDFSAAHANPLFLNSATGQALASTSSSKSSSSSSSNTAAIVVGVIVLVIVLAGGGFVLSRRRTT